MIWYLIEDMEKKFMQHDVLADAISKIKNAEKVGKRKCTVTSSSIIVGVLNVFKQFGYVNNFEKIDNKIRIELSGRINECKAIRPRFAITKDAFEKFEKRYLPAKDIGVLVISTSKGIMSKEDAVKNGIGGRILAIVY